MTSRTVAVAGIAANAVLAAVGVFAIAGSVGYGIITENGRVGTGFLPALCGGLVALFALYNLAAELRRGRPGRVIADDAAAEPAVVTTSAEGISRASISDTDILGRTQRQRNRMLASVAVILVGSITLVPLTGLLLALFIMLMACVFLVERRAILPSVLICGIAVVAAYFIFGVFLRVPLPAGIFGIL